MKLFDDKLIQDTIRSIHLPYQFNTYENNPFTLDAVISSGEFSSNSTFYIHSLNSFQCGDYTKINKDSNDVYMVTSDVSMRGGKYKGKLEYCNYDIEKWETIKTLIGYDQLGRPVYDYVKTLVGIIPSVLKYKDFTITTNESINLTKLIYEITVRDSAAAQTNFKLDESTYPDITIYDMTYRIVNVDYSKKGLIRIRLEKR